MGVINWIKNVLHEIYEWLNKTLPEEDVEDTAVEEITEPDVWDNHFENYDWSLHGLCRGFRDKVYKGWWAYLIIGLLIFSIPANNEVTHVESVNMEHIISHCSFDYNRGEYENATNTCWCSEYWQEVDEGGNCPCNLTEYRLDRLYLGAYFGYYDEYEEVATHLTKGGYCPCNKTINCSEWVYREIDNITAFNEETDRLYQERAKEYKLD